MCTSRIILDKVGAVVQRTIDERANPANEHAFAQLAAYAQGALDVAFEAGVICVSEKQAALAAVSGKEYDKGDQWW